MPLQSSLFAGDPKLEACLLSDPAHLTPGVAGPHVAKIQAALASLDGADIASGERAAATYGPATAAAVLAYKRKRGIVNRAYQTQADDIVGKMTIAALDRELLALESHPVACRLDEACPSDVESRGAPRRATLAVSFAIGAGPAATPTDADIMRAALDESRRTVRIAIDRLTVLAGKLQLGNDILTDDERAALVAAISWLRIDPEPLTPANKKAIAATIRRATNLLERSLAVRTSSGGDPQMRRAPVLDHARTFGDPDKGVECGEPFFKVDGPNCRRDVITHEFLHFVGVHHGGGALMGPTIRHLVKTTAQALDSADNLAQLVAEIVTPGRATDACAGRGSEALARGPAPPHRCPRTIPGTGC